MITYRCPQLRASCCFCQDLVDSPVVPGMLRSTRVAGTARKLSPASQGGISSPGRRGNKRTIIGRSPGLCRRGTRKVAFGSVIEQEIHSQGKGRDGQPTQAPAQRRASRKKAGEQADGAKQTYTQSQWNPLHRQEEQQHASLAPGRSSPDLSEDCPHASARGRSSSVIRTVVQLASGSCAGGGSSRSCRIPGEDCRGHCEGTDSHELATCLPLPGGE
jgi:hypothetical protein